jgi:hypothetical protein
VYGVSNNGVCVECVVYGVSTVRVQYEYCMRTVTEYSTSTVAEYSTSTVRVQWLSTVRVQYEYSD